MSTSPQTAQSDRLAAAKALARQGMFLTALERLGECDRRAEWWGAQRIDVGWIVRELGAPRLSLWHVLQAYREEPTSLAVRNDYAAAMIEDRGPLETLEFLEQQPPPSGDEAAEPQLHWMWLQGACYGMLRDFEAAHRWVRRMETVGERPEDPCFLRAQLLERQDRYDEALASIERAIDYRATHRATQYKAHLLTLRGADDQAYALLAEADADKQVASFAWQMSAIAYERCDFADCEAKLARFETLTPLRERSFADAFLLLRSELARRRGDDAEAIAHARRSRTARGRSIAEMLADPDRLQATDRLLDVPFIRQHEMTCGPATLAAISAYWEMRAEHLEVAEEICYAGTSTYAERQWAESHGFATAEFTVTEPVTEALIDRGIPFTLVTRGAGFAHLQAVVGYDGRTSTALIRDPYHRTRGMADLQRLLEKQAAHGPRGMALVPASRATLLEEIHFPDAELYDCLHRFDGALIAHQRPRAIEALEELRGRAPEHRLRWQAERQLGIYDGNEEVMLQAVQVLLERHPDDASLQLSEVSLLGSLGRQTQRLERLRALVDQPRPHPLLVLQLAETLSQDGRTREEAERHMREAIRRAAASSRAYLSLADLWFWRGRRAEALRLYRFAACLEETDEHVAGRYFDAAVATGDTEEVLEWLRGRFERLGGKSMQPTVTLVDALLRQRRYDEALEVLEEAQRRRGDDNELKLYAARVLADLSSEHWELADRLLEEARQGAPERLWHSTAARLCVLRGELDRARQHWDALLPRNPLALGIHEQIADLSEQLEGPGAASEHWRQAAEQFPHFIPLQERYAMSLRDRPLAEVEPVLSRIIEANPENAWAERELAVHLLGAGKLEAAEQRIARAVELDAEDPFIAHLKSTLAYRRGRVDEAIDLLHQALENDINDEHAVSKLINFCDGVEQTRNELDWLLRRLQESTLTGQVVMQYRDYAQAIMPAEEVLEQLREAQRTRSEFWPVHQAVIRQLAQMQRYPEAAAAADHAIERFPLEPNTWYERFQVALAMGDQEKQMEMLQRLRLLRPENAAVLRALADLYCNLGQFDTARQMLEELVTRQPLDPINRGYLGDCLLDLKEYEAAYDQFERAVRLLPDYDFAWNMLERLAVQLNREGTVETLARELAEERPHDVAVWLRLAKIEAIEGNAETAEQCLAEAERIDPYNAEIHSRRSQLRLNQGDREGALAALDPPIYSQTPTRLRCQRAQLLWDLGEQDEAYALIRRTCDETPALPQAWKLLEGWALQKGDRATAVAAIDRQIELSPSDPDVLDAAGNTYATLREHDRAIAVLQRAIEIAPNFTASRCVLFDLLAEHQRWDEAAEAVTNLARMDDHPAVIARRMEVAGARGDEATRQQALREILSQVPENRWALNKAVHIERAHRSATSLADQLREQIEQWIDAYGDAAEQTDDGHTASREDYETAMFAVAGHWVEQIFGLPRLRFSKQIRLAEQQANAWFADARPGGEPAGRSVLANLLRQVGSQPRLRLFHALRRRNGDRIVRDPHLWSMVAYLLADRPRRFSRRLLRQWSRAGEGLRLKPWMKTNAQELLRLTGQTERARAMVRDTVDSPADHMFSQLALWAAHDALVAGDDRAALQYFLKAARLEDLEGNDRLLHLWVEAGLQMRQADDKEAAFAQVRSRLDEHQPAFGFLRDQPLYAGMLARTVGLAVSAAGTFAARRWGYRKRLLLAWAALSRV